MYYYQNKRILLNIFLNIRQYILKNAFLRPPVGRNPSAMCARRTPGSPTRKMYFSSGRFVRFLKSFIYSVDLNVLCSAAGSEADHTRRTLSIPRLGRRWKSPDLDFLQACLLPILPHPNRTTTAF